MHQIDNVVPVGEGAPRTAYTYAEGELGGLASIAMKATRHKGNAFRPSGHVGL